MIHWSRTHGTRARVPDFRAILDLLRTDARFRAFHEGRTPELPEYYHRKYEEILGQYAPLVSRADRIPVLDRGAPLTSIELKAAAM